MLICIKVIIGSAQQELFTVTHLPKISSNLENQSCDFCFFAFEHVEWMFFENFSLDKNVKIILKFVV